MGRIATITRRTLLVGAVAVAGGVAFGTWRYKTPYDNPLLDCLGEGEAALTPYVKIDAGGVTLITPRADKGQGTYHVQAALIAEELDIDLDRIRVDPGPPSKAYWNTAVADEFAQFFIPAAGVAQNALTAGLDTGVKILGLQLTGGSSTVPDQFEKLRMAGAVARETLKAAAAKQSGVPVAQLKTANGAVQLPDGSELTYVALAPVAAAIEPVNHVTLRDPSTWRLLGKPMQRIDMVAKCTGTQAYGIDAHVDGMVHAAILLNPALGGARESFDGSEALTMRGVKAVLPVTGGVAVVADNTWRAFQAVQAVKAEWGKAPFPASMEEHWQALSGSFVDGRRNSRNRDDGNVETALAGTAPVEAEYRAPYLAHAPLEPVNAIVRVNNDSTVDVWAGTQIPRFVQTNVARIAGVDADKVRVHVLMMGGSFGHRLEDEAVRRAAEIAVQMKGTPVKLTYSREQDMTHEFPRQIAMARVRGAVKDGKVDAFDLSIAMPAILPSQFGRQGLPVAGPDGEIVAGAWNQPFAIPNMRVTGYRVPELVPVSSWRSVGASSNGFFFNAALDELIEAAGADPMEERLRLCNDPLARKVLEAVAEMSGWTGARPAPGTGRGVAFTKSFGVHCAEVVEVSGTADGIRIGKVWVAAEVGRVLDPVNFDNQVKGGVIFGLGHAMNCELTYRDGMAEQSNFDSYEGMRFNQCPVIEVRGLENGSKVLGIGEPPVPPAAPALAGAIFAATGKRLREMPFSKAVTFA